jgi:hypothetical protein
MNTNGESNMCAYMFLDCIYMLEYGTAKYVDINLVAIEPTGEIILVRSTLIGGLNTTVFWLPGQMTRQSRF